jgi:hypothetical protein
LIKNANFNAENCRKSQKIVIITSVPGWPDWANFQPMGDCLFWATFWKFHKNTAHIFVLLFRQVLIIYKVWKVLGYIFGDFITNSSGHPPFNKQAGWPDAFVNKIAQNVAQSIYVLSYIFDTKLFLRKQTAQNFEVHRSVNNFQKWSQSIRLLK